MRDGHCNLYGFHPDWQISLIGKAYERRQYHDAEYGDMSVNGYPWFFQLAPWISLPPHMGSYASNSSLRLRLLKTKTRGFIDRRMMKIAADLQLAHCGHVISFYIPCHPVNRYISFLMYAITLHAPSEAYYTDLIPKSLPSQFRIMSRYLIIPPQLLSPSNSAPDQTMDHHTIPSAFLPLIVRPPSSPD